MFKLFERIDRGMTTHDDVTSVIALLIVSVCIAWILGILVARMFVC